jgi:8-oxo-dGTP pyrophosphatase MutT (NUDIX family)
MPKDFKTREEKIYRLEVHVAGIYLREKQKRLEVLIAKRLPTRELYPEKWECGGGQVKPGESFEEAIKRQLFEEFGLLVKVVQPIGTYEIITGSEKQAKIPGVKFLCLPENSKGEIALNQKEFSEYKWVSLNSIYKFDMIPGISRDIKRAAQLYQVIFSPPKRRF